jgi:prepilin-type N-terminal cleavage/methylation domain-containing protein
MNRQTLKRHGFSIVELLIALIIISILSLIAVPTVANRAREARIRRAESELMKFQDAQQRAAIDTGYYYRLYVLDDVKGGDDIGQPSRIDGINDERLNTLPSNPTQIFISTETGYLLNSSQAAVIWNVLTRNETLFDRQLNWQGPYLSWQDVNASIWGGPLDPWGNPYLLFTQLGYIPEPEGVMIISTSPRSIRGDPGGNFTPSRFDRMTIVSIGPNGLIGDGTQNAEPGSGDDLKIQW